jgi:hypothetical protein
MLYSEIIAVCFEIHTKHINTLCGQSEQLRNVKLVLNIVTTGSLRLNTECPTTYQTRHFFNNSKTNEDNCNETDTHYRQIPLHFSHNERTPVQISLQYLHWF